MSLSSLRATEGLLIVNFKIHEINRDIYKLFGELRTLIIIIKFWSLYKRESTAKVQIHAVRFGEERLDLQLQCSCFSNPLLLNNKHHTKSK